MGRKFAFVLILCSLAWASCGEQQSTIVSVTPSEQNPLPTPSLPLSSDRPIQVFFSNVVGTVSANRSHPRNIAGQCAQVIASARQTLDICCHEIDNAEIIQAVLDASKRGVRVRVVTEADYADEKGPKAFRAQGIPVLIDTRTALMHNKFIVVDNRAVWTGSFNFTDNGAFKNNNNGVYLIDDNVAANFTEKFRWFWEERKFGGRPSKSHLIPSPQVQMRDGTIVETYYSTHDKIDQKVIAALSRARSSIEFLAFSFTHDDIARTMIEQAHKGVQVYGVVESRQNSKYSEFSRLEAEPNIHVLLDGNKWNMHHKVIIIDRNTVITGSFNFSASASTDNDENVVIIHNPSIANLFHEEFVEVYTEAQRSIAATPNAPLRR